MENSREFGFEIMVAPVLVAAIEVARQTGLGFFTAEGTDRIDLSSATAALSGRRRRTDDRTTPRFGSVSLKVRAAGAGFVGIGVGSGAGLVDAAMNGGSSRTEGEWKLAPYPWV